MRFVRWFEEKIRQFTDIVCELADVPLAVRVALKVDERLTEQLRAPEGEPFDDRAWLDSGMDPAEGYDDRFDYFRVAFSFRLPDQEAEKTVALSVCRESGLLSYSVREDHAPFIGIVPKEQRLTLVPILLEVLARPAAWAVDAYWRFREDQAGFSRHGIALLVALADQLGQDDLIIIRKAFELDWIRYGAFRREKNVAIAAVVLAQMHRTEINNSLFPADGSEYCWSNESHTHLASASVSNTTAELTLLGVRFTGSDARFLIPCYATNFHLDGAQRGLDDDEDPTLDDSFPDDEPTGLLN